MAGEYLSGGLLPIESDQERFRQILRGRVRKDLAKHIGNDSLIGKTGDKIVSIPVPTIELPSFRFARGGEGVGQGKGEGLAGDEPGEHLLEVELDEVLDWIEEEVELSNLKPSKQGNISGGEKWRERGAQRGKRPGFKFRRSFLNALRDGHDPKMAVVLSRTKPYALYRSNERVEIPTARAVIIFIADCSGSMDETKKNLMRKVCKWYQLLLGRHYPTLEWRFIVHDTEATEVNEETYFHLTTGGGTKIVAGMNYADELVKAEYDDGDWNIFVNYFGDGESFDDEDDRKSIEILEKALLPKVRNFAYVQLRGQSDKFKNKMDRVARRSGEKDNNGRMVTTRINEKEQVLEGIRTICGKKNG